jgi:hypothetical protein
MNIKKCVPASGLALAVALAFATPAAWSAEVYLQARQQTLTPAGSATPVPMYGYVECVGGFANCPATAPEWTPGPVIAVANGDTSLVVHLQNLDVPAPVSLVIPGLRATEVLPSRTASSTPLQGLAPAEVAAGGEHVYRFTVPGPGTYLYMSGSSPRTQVQMGLYGAVAAAYAPGTYAGDKVLLYSEIDPALHQNVQPVNLLNYQPRFHLINGKAYEPGAAPAIAAATGDPILLRLVNAGLQNRAPRLLPGYFDNIVSEDGHATSVARSQYSVLLAAGKTLDVAFTPPAAGTYQLFDGRFGLTNDLASGGGMLTSIVASGDLPAPTARNDAYRVDVGQTLTVPRPGVLGNDSPLPLTLSAALVTPPATGTFSLAADGSFVYTPLGAGVQSFTYTAANVSGTSAPATVTLTAVAPNHPPVAVDDPIYYVTQNTGTQSFTTPSVLANDSDPDGDAITAGNPSGLTLNSPANTGATVPLAANGTFSFTATGEEYNVLAALSRYFVGDLSFTYTAVDSHGAASAPATVRIVKDFRVGLASRTVILTGNRLTANGRLRGFGSNQTVTLRFNLSSITSCPVANRGQLVAQLAVNVPASVPLNGSVSWGFVPAASNPAIPSGCSQIDVSADIPAAGAIPAHTARLLNVPLPTP